MNKKQTVYAMIGVLIVIGIFVLGNAVALIGQTRALTELNENNVEIAVPYTISIIDVLPIFVALLSFLIALFYMFWRELKNEKRAN